MQDQVFDHAAGLRAGAVASVQRDLAKLSVRRVAKAKAGVAPQIFLVVVGYLFLVVERFDRVGVGIVRMPQQETRHRQSEVTRIRAVAERVPLGVLRAVEDAFEDP